MREKIKKQNIIVSFIHSKPLKTLSSLALSQKTKLFFPMAKIPTKNTIVV